MRIGILGPLEVRDTGGQLVPVGGARLRGFLIRLVISGGRPVPVDRLAEDLWAADRPADPIRRSSPAGRPGQPASRMPRNSAASALMPVSAPNTAIHTVLRARACSAAVTPEMATTISFTTRVVS